MSENMLNKQGRPVSDRVLSDQELVEVFRQKLRLGFHKIEERFRSDKSRTDKYRTMLVRLCKRVLGEVMALIGIDSYAKSNQVEKYLPEYQKRFEQMKRVVISFLGPNCGASKDLMALSSETTCSNLIDQCQVHLSLSFFSLYVSKERCLKMANSIGVCEAKTNSLLQLRE